jgi:hypothetical protein
MLMISLGKVRQLSHRERWLLFRSLLLLPVVHAALSIFGYSRLRIAMEKIIPLKDGRTLFSRANQLEEAYMMARIISIAAQYGVYKATCLRRSLVLWWLLREDGISSQICLGVRIHDHQLDAHAWVEADGFVVNDAGNIREQFKILDDGILLTSTGL